MPDPGLHRAFRMIPAAHNRRAAISGAALGKLGEKGISLGHSGRLQQFPSAFATRSSVDQRPRLDQKIR